MGAISIILLWLIGRATTEDVGDFAEGSTVRTALEQGLDLKEHAGELLTQINLVEAELVADYVAKVPELVALESNISVCEGFLDSMTRLLESFQRDLGSVSTEIAALQFKSQQLALRHRNRASFQSKLGEVLDGTVLSPDLIAKLVDGEIDEAYQECVQQLDTKMSFVKRNKALHIRAFKDVGPELERLRNKVADKARDFFLDKIRQLRQANTNLQMHQANVLLRNKPVHDFILQWHPEVAQEVRGHYVHVVSRFHHALFEKYVKSVSRLVAPFPDRGVYIGSAEESREGILGSTMAFFKAPLTASLGGGSGSGAGGSSGANGSRSSTSSASSSSSPLYTIGDRIRVLRDTDAPVVMGHIAEESGQKFSLEVVVRSLVRLLADTASTEYGFNTVFFHNRRPRLGPPTVIAQAVFVQVFDATLKTIGIAFTSWMASNFDLLGLALSAKIVEQHAQMLATRGVTISSLAHFMGSLRTQFIERYTLVVGLHAESIRKARHAVKEPVCHYISRRYGEFACSVLLLDMPELNAPLLALRKELEEFLARAARDLADTKEQTVFSINNYDAIASLLEEACASRSSDVPSSLQEELKWWQRNLHQKTLDFVDLSISPKFGFLTRFVDESEPQVPLDAVPAPSFERVAEQFGQVWKSHLGALVAEVSQYFANYRQGTNVLQLILTQVAVYWQRYHSLLEKRFGKAVPPFKFAPVGTQNVLVELKKYVKP
ncbi:Sac2 family-domain-containing protein [Blastocladiella britannica]|nr:Sac2 family-domain-containing protein [Blastocladiella britannica]